MKEEAERRMHQLNGWILADTAIEKGFKFVDFKAAIDFVDKVADLAEGENHHPDILLWGWNNVKITLSTHKVGGLSDKDFILASKIDQIKIS